MTITDQDQIRRVHDYEISPIQSEARGHKISDKLLQTTSCTTVNPQQFFTLIDGR